MWNGHSLNLHHSKADRRSTFRPRQYSRSNMSGPLNTPLPRRRSIPESSILNLASKTVRRRKPNITSRQRRAFSPLRRLLIMESSSMTIRPSTMGENTITGTTNANRSNGMHAYRSSSYDHECGH